MPFMLMIVGYIMEALSGLFAGTLTGRTDNNLSLLPYQDVKHLQSIQEHTNTGSVTQVEEFLSGMEIIGNFNSNIQT
jgi:hypothetical protein